MSLIFNNSVPHGLKKKQLYNEDDKFTDNDLQDVLDGLLKLGVSPNTTKQQKSSPHSRHHSKSSLSPSSANYKSSSSNSPLNPSQPPTSTRNPFTGFNLLYEAAKKVEGKENFFKMDIADIEQVTHSNSNSALNTSIYDEETGILRSKSKNAICAPTNMDDVNETLFLPTFDDLNDDFTLHSNLSSLDKRLSGISSIGGSGGRRASMLSSSLNLSLQSIEEQKEQRRQCREWSLQNIKEMDQMYLNKSKLAQRHHHETSQSVQDKNSEKSIQSSSKLGVDEICKEFAESNEELNNVINAYNENIDQIKKEHEKLQNERNRQNEILQQQLQRMQDKILRQQQQEKDIALRRKEEAAKQKQQKLIEQQQQKQKDAENAKKIEAEKRQKQKEKEENERKMAEQKQRERDIKSQKEWYPHQKKLKKKCDHYKAMYNDFEALIDKFESSDFEMNIGLILRSVSSNQKSVFDAYKRFEKLINEQTQPRSAERGYCFIQITNLIISDVRIVKSSAQKFASSYFLSFVMNKFENEYLEILKCCFYNQCLWTMPFIDPQLNILSKQPSKPSLIRCVLLKYANIKNIQNVPSEKRKYLQSFTKSKGGNVVFESEDKYFTRSQHVCGLFAAFMSIRDNNEFKNPFGIDSGDCWRWIAHLLSMPKAVYPELCAILSIIIQVIGHEMLQKYPRQFPKIIRYIHEHIWRYTDTSTTSRGKAQRELNLFMRQCQDSMKSNNGKIKIEKPKESQLIEETVGASALTNIDDRPRGGNFRGRGRGRGRGGGGDRRWR